MLRKTVVLSGLLIFLFSFSTFAAVPKLINFQGKLTSSQGTPETGNQNLTFRIYNVETGGSSIWDETVNGIVLDSAGQFSTVLGLGGSPSNLSINFSQPLWLQVEYGGQIFTPRQRLSSVPYALYAITAESLAGGISQEIINLTVNNNLTVSGTGDSTFTGSVGIGTSDATSKLTVWGTAEVTGFKMLTGASSGYVLTSDINGRGTWQPSTGGGTNYWTQSGSKLYPINLASDIGIGTSEPTDVLTIVRDQSVPRMRITGYGIGSGGPAANFPRIAGRFARGSLAFPATVNAGDVLFVIGGVGYSDSGFLDTETPPRTAGMIGIYADGTFTGSSTPGRIVFSTASSEGSSVQRLVLNKDGSVGIGTAEPASKLTVAGTIETTGGIKFPDGTIQISKAGIGGGDISGNGTAGNVAKFTGNKVINDSTITDNGANVGIGTAPGTTKLKVAGTIESTIGGIKFPDGNIQTIAYAGGGGGGGGISTADADARYLQKASGTMTGKLTISSTMDGVVLKVIGSAEIGNAPNSATGQYSIAMGDNTIASGDDSTAMGNGTDAIGYTSTAMGFGATATGIYSTAMGYDTYASGDASTAMGFYTSANPYASLVIGQYNKISGQPGDWIDTDPVFVIGNGTGPGNRSNAFTVMKNGSTGIGTAEPGSNKLKVAGTVEVTNDLFVNGTGSSHFNGTVGIGTAEPGSNKLKVVGTIETTGGIKFPTGTQTAPYTGGGAGGTIGIPKTGQTTSYRTGDDGYYEKGQNVLKDNGDGYTVTDTRTGLMWPKSGTGAGYGGLKTWNNAIDWAESNTLAGYTDWRLPNVNELRSFQEVTWGFYNGQPGGVYWSSTSDPLNTNYAQIVAFYHWPDMTEASAWDKSASGYTVVVRGGE